MGFDISYHPISPEEINDWYFSRLDEVKNNNLVNIEKISALVKMENFYLDKYKSTMIIASKTTTSDIFDKTHSYYLSVIQGFFRTYFYTRGTAFSFLISENPEMKIYTEDLMNFISIPMPNPINNMIIENYCGGVYIPHEKLVLLYDGYKSGALSEILNGFYEQNIGVFLKAVEYSIANGLGLLEASEVVEINPVDINLSTSYSNLHNCDPDGAFIYCQTAKNQIDEVLANSIEPSAKGASKKSDEEEIKKIVYEKIEIEEKPKKKGFWKRIFGK